jgi:hypothetical protein
MDTWMIIYLVTVNTIEIGLLVAVFLMMRAIFRAATAPPQSFFIPLDRIPIGKVSSTDEKVN